MGPSIAAIGFVLAFSLVWHIWWLVVLALLAGIASVLLRGFSRNTTRIVSAQEVQREHQLWIDAVAKAAAISRADECEPANVGLAMFAADGEVP